MLGPARPSFGVHVQGFHPVPLASEKQSGRLGVWQHRVVSTACRTKGFWV